MRTAMANVVKLAPKTFDDAKLQVMIPPLTVRIEKLRGNQRTPIPMPPGEDPEAAPGTGLSHDDIRGLETWLVTQWTGGGHYEISVTDSSTPNPLKMTWQPYYNPAEYAERKPPIHSDATAIPSAPQAPQPTQMRGPMTAFPNGFPTYGQPFAQPFQPTAYTPFPPLPAPPPVGGPQWGAYTAEVDKRRQEDELKTLREESARREREAVAAKHEMALAAERQANEQRARAVEAQMADLRNMLAQLSNSINNGNTKNPEIEALKAAAIESERRADRERAEREAERRAAETRDMIKAMQEGMQRQMEESRRATEAQLAALRESTRDRGPDPMIALFTEAQRNNSEALKEISRNAQAQITQLQSQMLRPQDILAITTSANQAADANGAKIATAYGGVLEMQTKVMEQALNMAPQGSGVVDVVRDGVNGLKDFAERYVGAKAAEQRVVANAQVSIAQANAMAVAAAHGQQLNGPPQPAPAEQPVYAPPPPREQAQLGKPRKPVEGVDGMPPSANKHKRLGRTDLEWFGPAITEVEALREQVDIYLDAMTKIAADQPVDLDAKGNPPGASAEATVVGILAATQMAMQQGIAIPAMVELLVQGRYADFLDVLIPNATQPYRDHTAQILGAKIAILNGEPADEDDEDEDEDDDEGDEDGDDANHDGSQHEAVVVKPNGKPPQMHVVPTPKKPQKGAQKPSAS
jgi:hypothetical protein